MFIAFSKLDDFSHVSMTISFLIPEIDPFPEGYSLWEINNETCLVNSDSIYCEHFEYHTYFYFWLIANVQDKLHKEVRALLYTYFP